MVRELQNISHQPLFLVFFKYTLQLRTLIVKWIALNYVGEFYKEGKIQAKIVRFYRTSCTVTANYNYVNRCIFQHRYLSQGSCSRFMAVSELLTGGWVGGKTKRRRRACFTNSLRRAYLPLQYSSIRISSESAINISQEDHAYTNHI